MHLFSVYFFRDVFYFNTHVCYQNPSNKNKDNVEQILQRCDILNSANST